MSTRRWFDPVRRRYWDMQPLAVVRAVAPLRHGPRGALRHHVRCLLLHVMGIEDCDEVPLDAQIPHQFPQSRFAEEEKYRMGMEARDGLRELGYDASADVLERAPFGYNIRAKDALVLLEAGPPSVMLGHEPIFTHTIGRFRSSEAGRSGEYLVGRSVGDPRWWYRFSVGVPVHDQRGQWVGWNPEGGYTFQRRGRTLEDVAAGLYGSAAIVPTGERFARGGGTTLGDMRTRADEMVRAGAFEEARDQYLVAADMAEEHGGDAQIARALRQEARRAVVLAWARAEGLSVGAITPLSAPFARSEGRSFAVVQLSGPILRVHVDQRGGVRVVGRRGL